MSIPANAALARIMQIAINVHDVDRATTFYRDVLALPHLFRAGQLSFFDCGGVRLMLSTPEKLEFDHPGSLLYFRVDDIQAAFQRLQSAGAKFEDQPHLIAPHSRAVDDSLPRHRRQPSRPYERSRSTVIESCAFQHLCFVDLSAAGTDACPGCEDSRYSSAAPMGTIRVGAPAL
jgi:catechol 2,3-dioxygenase-like lactoylglutathione lyase family enzyme